MQFSGTEWVALVGHSPTQGAFIHGIEAHAEVRESGIGVFRYVLQADISRARIPPEQSPKRADDLWNHTCFEAFIGAPDATGYYEFNFAPSRLWAAYRFIAYREGRSSPDLPTPPQISVRRFADRLELDAAVPLRDFIVPQGAPRLRVGLNAVVEEENGTLSYWAVKHAPGKADFHWPDGFVLDLSL
ncbi:MAG TPA: DOMON-like domain-containing protein [Steroidobacteraceae bacterium]|jgi:hypothetical protein|nr:DOMON-like domain-containing protein [Steroidobacteraceae bacterium]